MLFKEQGKRNTTIKDMEGQEDKSSLKELRDTIENKGGKQTKKQ